MIDQVRCFKKWKKLHLYYLCFTLRDISRYGLVMYGIKKCKLLANKLDKYFHQKKKKKEKCKLLPG